MPGHASPSLAEAICTGSGPKKGDPTSFLKKRCNANHPQSCSCLSLIFQDPTFVIWTGFRLKCHMWGGVQCTTCCHNFEASQAKHQAGVHLLRAWNWEGTVSQNSEPGFLRSSEVQQLHFILLGLTIDRETNIPHWEESSRNLISRNKGKNRGSEPLGTKRMQILPVDSAGLGD